MAEVGSSRFRLSRRGGKAVVCTQPTPNEFGDVAEAEGLTTLSKLIREFKARSKGHLSTLDHLGIASNIGDPFEASALEGSENESVGILKPTNSAESLQAIDLGHAGELFVRITTRYANISHVCELY
jgi:hypothetical protein